MQPNPDWTTGRQAWDEFVARHPELGYGPGRWPFYNFLRHHRDALRACDAIRLARHRFWVAHRSRFFRAAFDLATGAAGARAVQLADERFTAAEPSAQPFEHCP